MADLLAEPSIHQLSGRCGTAPPHVDRSSGLCRDATRCGRSRRRPGIVPSWRPGRGAYSWRVKCSATRRLTWVMAADRSIREDQRRPARPSGAEVVAIDGDRLRGVRAVYRAVARLVQAAQTTRARGHQQLTPEHLLKALLDDEEGLAPRATREPQRRGTPAARARPSERAKQRAQGRRRGPARSRRARADQVADQAQILGEEGATQCVTAERPCWRSPGPRDPAPPRP